MERGCDICGKALRSDNRSGVCHSTRACANEQARRWRAANPEKERETWARSNLKRQHKGMTPVLFGQILALQSGRCAVCRCESPGGAGRWHIDHDHRTGQVRGLLCHGCNTGTKLTDDVALLRAKIDYLTRPLLRVVGSE